MRILPIAAAMTVASFAFVTPAFGHAELVPYQLPPGESGGLLLLVTHGCGDEEEWISTEPLEEEPTIAITVRAPLELDITPHELEGWTLSSETDEAGRLVSARWDSDDPDGTSETVQIPLDVTVADVPDGSDVWLPIIQECAHGESLEWTLEGDVRGGDEVPAMRLIVNEDATAPPLHGDDAPGSTAAATPAAPSDRARARTLDRFGVPSLVLAVIGAAGLSVAVLRRRGATDG